MTILMWTKTRPLLVFDAHAHQAHLLLALPTVTTLPVAFASP